MDGRVSRSDRSCALVKYQFSLFVYLVSHTKGAAALLRRAKVDQPDGVALELAAAVCCFKRDVTTAPPMFFVREPHTGD